MYKPMLPWIQSWFTIIAFTPIYFGWDYQIKKGERVKEKVAIPNLLELK